MSVGKISWESLRFSAEGCGLFADPDERRAALEELRSGKEPIRNFWFERAGFPHEDPDNVETWGPRAIEEIDWSGFIPLYFCLDCMDGIPPDKEGRRVCGVVKNLSPLRTREALLDATRAHFFGCGWVLEQYKQFAKEEIVRLASFGTFR